MFADYSWRNGFSFAEKICFPRTRFIFFIVKTAIIKQNQFHTENVNNDAPDPDREQDVS